MKTSYLLLSALLLLLFSACNKDYATVSSIGSGYEPASPIAGDQYATYEENPFVNVAEQPISTFSIDADGASYANVRRFLQQDNQLPPKAAVRTEELINYFDLDYSYDNTEHPISLNGEVSSCPWTAGNKLIRIGIKGQPVPAGQRPPANFVFLIDVSGSMGSDDKLELLKNGFKLFVDQLQEADKVAIVTYAGSAGVVLPATSGNEKQTIKQAINSLGSGGSTAGAEGILTAYEIAKANFLPNGNNRVILGSDGDFNVGPSSQAALVELIETQRDAGIFLTVLGVGRGNLNDAAMEQIANNGNGTYEYIDNLEQLKKVFIYDYDKFYTVAKDVKVQVTFNPDNVVAYRLIGYENRVLNTEDFIDDTRDAGEIGANQNITALYEIQPTQNPAYRTTPTFTIDFRYKQPTATISIPLQLDIYDTGKTFAEATDYLRFTSSVAAFSMLITDSPPRGTTTFDAVLNWLNTTHLSDPHGFKQQLKTLVTKAKNL